MAFHVDPRSMLVNTCEELPETRIVKGEKGDIDKEWNSEPPPIPLDSKRMGCENVVREPQKLMMKKYKNFFIDLNQGCCFTC